MDSANPIIKEFLTESYENLDQLDQDLVDLEANPEEISLLASIFRTIHTIKGTCGFLGFTKLESITHVGENLLSKLRDGELDMTPQIANALLSMVDAIRDILSSIDQEDKEGGGDYSRLVETLTQLQAEPAPSFIQANSSDLVQDALVPEPVSNVTVHESALPVCAEKSTLFDRLGGAAMLLVIVDLLDQKLLEDIRLAHLFDGVDMVHLKLNQRKFLSVIFGGPEPFDAEMMKEANAPFINQGLDNCHFEAIMEVQNEAMKDMKLEEEVIEEAVSRFLGFKDEILGRSVPATQTLNLPAGQEEIKKEVQDSGSMDCIGGADVSAGNNGGNGSNKPKNVPDEILDEAFGIADEKHLNTRSHAESIRVDVDLLDRLMNLVGELVLARNQITQFAVNDRDAAFITTTQHLNQLTSELQEGVMKTRMQPIGTIWNKFPRVVRDLSMACGKKIQLFMEGKDTELDKTLIEAIKDPLTHIVRNSVDHGIETPQERMSAGKNPEGRLMLRSYHEGGQVNVEIMDDGRGIDPEKIKDKALSKGLITPQQASRMGSRELISMIFNPGFSTAEKVSNLSGRGVGMDVVKTNIEKIGGTVDIQSQVGVGTTLKVKIPLTLAIIPALVVTCGGLRYAIPQVSLVELVRLDPEHGQNIEQIQGVPVYRLRGNLLPLVYLHEELGVDAQQQSDAINIVVLQADQRQFGLVVDGISDTEEIVVKPLGKQLKGITAYAGATIMGDGKVALILDAMGLAQKAHVVSEGTHGQDQSAYEALDEGGKGERHTLLIFNTGENTRMAVPLSMVARLEEFGRDQIEYSRGKEVVQYRGAIMPLINLEDLFGRKFSYREDDSMQVIVYSGQGRCVGVVVGTIIDIVDEAISIKTGSGAFGTLGSAVIQGKITDLLDVEGVIHQADPEFYENVNMASRLEEVSHG